MPRPFDDLPHLQGDVVRSTDADYRDHQYQYAFSSHGGDGSMSPGAIIYPKYPNADADIAAVIKYARDKGIAVAVRTGGHQYSGASSTGPGNLLLDMSCAYTDFDWNDDTGLLRAGISYALVDFNAKIGALGLFVPHGQCSHVHVGGHAHTGGYGQLTRAFGLFGDHIVGIEVFTADGVKRALKRDEGSQEDRDLFWAVLGGSPGNFGILTHVTLKPHRDVNYPNSRGLKTAVLYNKDTLQALMELHAKMADDPTFPGDIDFCVTVLSSAQIVLPHFGINDLPDDWITFKHTVELSTGNKIPAWPPVILVYVQWANTGGAAQAYDDVAQQWFADVRAAMRAGKRDVLHTPIEVVKPEAHTPLSKLTKAWLFTNVREFQMPYEKRAYVTNKTSLQRDKWTEWATERIDALQKDPTNGCKVVVQIQTFGGEHSQLRRLTSDATSYSWRQDTTVCAVLDCFFNPHDLAAKITNHDPQAEALAWQAENDLSVGRPGAVYCDHDRRYLWGSYGDRDLSTSWRFYYEDEAKYERLVTIKRRVDPTGVFTPNAFCVGGAPAAGPTVSVSVPYASLSDASGPTSLYHRLLAALTSRL